MDFAIIYILKKQEVPVFFLEPESQNLSGIRSLGRRQAINCAIDLLDFFSGTLPLLDLYGISALPVDTRFSVYKYYLDSWTLTPGLILPDPDVVHDTAPQERWNHDIMTEGEVRFKVKPRRWWPLCRELYALNVHVEITLQFTKCLWDSSLFK